MKDFPQSILLLKANFRVALLTALLISQLPFYDCTSGLLNYNRDRYFKDRIGDLVRYLANFGEVMKVLEDTGIETH